MRVLRGALVIAAVALAACGGSEPAAPANTGTTGPTGTTGSTGSTGPTGPVATNQVTVIDGAFNPASIVVTTGTTVTWTWGTPTTHNVTFTSTSLGGSANMSSGTYQKAFPTAGAFGYRCTLHAGMEGTVNVQ